ncbi:muts domain V-domain-containing protein [Hypoxylon sp. FL1150]|nr:muts domain V-domain-containing protein [Hypoxylon sp. FL1150]
MPSSHRYQSPTGSSSSSLFVPSASNRRAASTTNRRRPAPLFASSSSRGSSRNPSRASSRATATQSHPSSPQLPPLPSLPQRQRLSFRLPSSRASSVNSIRRPDNWNPLTGDALPTEDADALGEIIMAVDMKDNGNLGCAYYIAADETLFLLDDVAMSGIDLVETLLLHASPTTVLISARASEALASYLAKGAQGLDGNQGDLQSAYILRNLNSSDFRYESGREKLLGLNLEMPGRHNMLYTSVVDEVVDEMDEYGGQKNSRQARLMRLGTSINLDSRLTIGCAGAVLGDLQRRKTAHYLPNDPDALVAFRIRSVDMFSLFGSMFVNADTLVSLQILQSEYHPNRHQRGPSNSASGAKESLSVYGLFQPLARTPQGKLKLRQIFLRPSTDLDLILARQKTISFLLRPGNTEVLAQLSDELKKIKNMKSVTAFLEKGVDIPGRRISIASNVWASIQRFAAYSLQLRDSLRTLPGSENIVLLKKVIDGIQPQPLCQVGECISQTIDFDQSLERGRTAVKHGVDPNLDDLKRRYDGMEDLLTNTIARIRNELPEWARNYVQNCIFFPQLGFLTVVSANPETGKGNYDGEGLNDVWARMFATDGCVYYKNRQMNEMDELFGDAYCMIIDREIEIIHELAVKVLSHQEAIITASDVLGELDSIIALAIRSGQYNWVAPNMTTENVIHIEGGRHPLQELVVASFIANDCYVQGGQGEQNEDESSANLERPSTKYPSALILTGPNHSGKSVYLKQVALIVYLAHIGCFVPAQRARIGITDRILTRIATRESVAKNESAFSIDLRQVAFAINFATRRSLVLIDEFGKGTNCLDGAGMVTAVLDHFTSLGLQRPKVLAATHFHEIFENQFLEETPELAFGHMDVRLDLNAPTTEDQVTYLFQLAPGRSTSSFGIRCAAMNGVDPVIVERAESIMLMIAHNEDLEVACSKLSVAETQRLEEAEAVARNLLEQDIEMPSYIEKEPDLHRGYLNRIMSTDSSKQT